MTIFIYKGLRADGCVVEGELRAQVAQDAYRKMELLGLLPILVHEVSPEIAQNAAGETQGEFAGLADHVAG